MSKRGYVYILASKRNGTLYVGVTSNLVRRLNEHRSNALPGFTSRYHVHKLVYYEVYDSIYDAISREKRLKKWNRRWKLRLIQEFNPKWTDLFDDVVRGLLGM